MKIRVLLAFSLFSMALFGGGAVALAQPGADEPGPTNEDQAARLLFQSAREAFAVGEYERALSGFQQAYDLSRRPALLYNIGTTLDRLRRDDEALAIFEQFLREDPETPNRAEIESRVAQLRAGIQARHAREEAARLEAERVDAERRAAEEERRLAEEHHRLAEEAASGGTPPVLVISVGGVAVATGPWPWASVCARARWTTATRGTSPPPRRERRAMGDPQTRCARRATATTAPSRARRSPTPCWASAVPR
jgi:tetratricopeptide (TPR) repeat protein